jgi:RES domain-containing protein
MAVVYRIAAAGPAWDELDLQGLGAKTVGGRWNSVGVAMVYTASSIALAALETVVHLGAGVFPMNRYIVGIEIPEPEFAKKKVAADADLPPAWNSNPASFKSAAFGDKWARAGAELVLSVPSVIVPLERNYLLNPNHPAMAGVKARNLGKYIYDTRTLGAPKRP